MLKYYAKKFMPSYKLDEDSICYKLGEDSICNMYTYCTVRDRISLNWWYSFFFRWSIKLNLYMANFATEHRDFAVLGV